ncbi:hypothetical protein GS454_01370 [Rhodococcus hoagii]|nr:hypothetical protein [Prescottella equi]
MAYAELNDVSVRWAKDLTPEEEALVVARLADVERKILKRIPDLADKIAAGTVDVEDVKQVEADAVLRLVRNPEGYIQESDGDYSYMLSNEAAKGRLAILDEEWEQLGYVRRRVFMIDTTPPMVR